MTKNQQKHFKKKITKLPGNLVDLRNPAQLHLREIGPHIGFYQNGDWLMWVTRNEFEFLIDIGVAYDH